MTREPWYRRDADVADWLIVVISWCGIVAVFLGWLGQL